MTPSYLPFPQVTRRSSAALSLGALSLYLIEKQPLVHGVVETLPSGHIRTCPLGWWRREASRQAASAPQRALRSQRTATAPLAASRADRPPRSAAPRPCFSLQTGPSGGGGQHLDPAGRHRRSESCCCFLQALGLRGCRGFPAVEDSDINHDRAGADESRRPGVRTERASLSRVRTPRGPSAAAWLPALAGAEHSSGRGWDASRPSFRRPVPVGAPGM